MTFTNICIWKTRTFAITLILNEVGVYIMFFVTRYFYLLKQFMYLLKVNKKYRGMFDNQISGNKTS